MNDSTITIQTGTIFKAILVILLFVLLYLLRDLVLVLLTAVVIASATEPLTRWLTKRKIPRTLAVILIYVLFAFFFAGVFYFFLPPLLGETTGFLNLIPQYIETIEENSLNNNLVGELTENFSLMDSVSALQGMFSGASEGIVKSISVIFGGLFSFVLIVVISFYLSVREKGIEDFLQLITPERYEERIVNLWERSQRKIGLWMQGQLLLGVIVGVLVFLGLTILQVKYALLLAVLAAVFEIIPLFGPILAAAPAVALGFSGGLQLGFMVLGLYFIIQQFENHLIYPLVVRKVVGVSPIVVIIALVVGAKLAGFLGLLLAVPVSAALVEFAEDIRKEKSALKKSRG